MKRFILSALFFIALLSIWHLLVLAKVWSPVLLPDPISVWEYLKGAAEDGTLLHKIVYSYDASGKQTGYSVLDASGKLVGGQSAAKARPSSSPKAREKRSQ